MEQIKNITQLKLMAKKGNRHDFFVALNFSLVSNKKISYYNKKFNIVNLIDNTRQKLTEQELYTLSNIGKALDNGALYIR